jgi:hypothetical protein
MGDSTAHGGTIVLGCPTVLIGEVSPGSVVTKTSLTILNQMRGGKESSSSAGASTQNKIKIGGNDEAARRVEAAGVAEQVLTMQQAADEGKPFCEICNK